MKQTEQELVFSLQSWFTMFIAAVYVGQPVYPWGLIAVSLCKRQTLSDGELINAMKNKRTNIPTNVFIIVGVKIEPIIASMWHFNPKKRLIHAKTLLQQCPLVILNLLLICFNTNHNVYRVEKESFATVYTQPLKQAKTQQIRLRGCKSLKGIQHK